MLRWIGIGICICIGFAIASVMFPVLAAFILALLLV